MERVYKISFGFMNQYGLMVDKVWSNEGKGFDIEYAKRLCDLIRHTVPISYINIESI